MIEIFLGLTLFGSAIWSFIIVGLYLALCIYNDVIEDGIAAFVVGIVILVTYGIWSNVDFKSLWENFSFIYVAIYFGIGIVHAIIRSFFYGRAKQKEFLKILEDNPKTYHKVNLDIKAHVFRWMLMWPISMTVWFLKDIVKDIWDYGYDKFGKIFSYFLQLGIKTVPVEKVKNKDI